MDPLTGPGLVPLVGREPGAPDLEVEPAGYLVEADDAVRLHFLDWDAPGDPRPVRPHAAPGFLLVHGLATTAWAWASVARRLRTQGRVVAMDLRGHGLSDAPTGGYRPDRLADDAVAVAEGAGVLPIDGGQPAGPLVVAGIGLGAIVAAWAARALGSRCAGLALVDGGWENLAVATGATTEEWLAGIEEPPEVLASMEAWLGDREEFDPATWDADQERAARSQVVETAAGRVKVAVHPHALAASVRAMWSYDPAAVLPAVEARVAALVARDDDGSRALALGTAARLRQDAGRSPILTASFLGRGHNLLRHEPAAVAAALLELADGPA